MGERAVRYAPERAPSSSTSARSARRSRSSTAGSRRARPTTPTVVGERKRRRRGLGDAARRSAARGSEATIAPPEPILRRLSGDEVAMVEAADLFNASTYRRTVGGIAKSLGAREGDRSSPLSGDDRRDRRHRRLGHLLVPVPRQPRLGPAGAAGASAATSPTSSRRPSRSWNAHVEDEGRLVPEIAPPLALTADLPTIRRTMIYCVIPRELEDELYDKMVEYYKDNPNVTVIVDRREGTTAARARPRRRSRSSARCATAAAPRVTGTFPDTDPPPDD